mgnify:CR=1 FL=1
MNKIINRIVSILLIPISFLFILSSSILVPTIDRNFYFMQIDKLGIVANSGFTKPQIIEAYNNLFDFLWTDVPFKTGDLVNSESAISHYTDCKKLFALDLIVFIITAVLLLTILFLIIFKKVKIERYFGFSPLFFSSILLVVFLLSVVIFGLINFDELFRVFHLICFPGKDNWLFDWNLDQTIRILPEQFFTNCAILIGSLIAIQLLVAITYSIVVKIKLSKKSQ